MLDPDEHASRSQMRKVVRKWLIIICMAVAFVGTCVDPGPLLPPFPASFQSFDCHYVTFQSFSDDNGRLTVNFTAPDAIEYPPQYLPNFIQVKITTGRARLNYFGMNATSYSKSGTALSLGYFHQFPGTSSVSIHCAGKFLNAFDAELKELHPPDDCYSCARLSGGAAARFSQVCLEDDKLLFFSPNTGEYGQITDGLNVTLDFREEALKKFIARAHLPSEMQSGYLIAPLVGRPTELFLFVLPQLFDALRGEPDLSHARFWTWGEPGSVTERVSSFLGMQPPRNRSSPACFQDLIVPIGRQDAASIESAVLRNFSFLREKVQRESTGRKSIVVAPGLRYKLEERIREICPDCQVQVVDPHFEKWPAKFRGAIFLVANHLSNLIPAVLMGTGATVIDVAPERCRWQRRFVEANGLRYVSIRNASACRCESFACYPPDPPPFDDADIGPVIELMRQRMSKSAENLTQDDQF
jgi:hypothetical protein